MNRNGILIDNTRKVEDVKVETSLSKAKVRSKSMTCINCQRPLWGYKHAKTLRYDMETMHRIYTKSGSKWKAIGWSCPRCGSIILDEVKIYEVVTGPMQSIKVPPTISAVKILI